MAFFRKYVLYISGTGKALEKPRNISSFQNDLKSSSLVAILRSCIGVGLLLQYGGVD